jgi:superfamily I DNA/RNA helicase
MMTGFDFLNEEQLRAVAHPIGRPACLIAGAGSGKTATITARVAWLMENDVPPFRICCITFTNKAAGEIARRVGLADSAPAESRPHISTIHSLALSAIRRDPEGFGFEGKVTPMDDYDQAQMCKKLIERMPQEMGMEMNAYRFLEKLAYHRARGVGFSDGYTEEVHEEALEHHKGYHALEDWEARLWRLFEEEKRKCGTVDFDDMIHLVVRRGEAEDAWRAALQRRFHHVLQDESQDTSPVQWRFVNLLLGDDNPNLYCVGDLAQSIYAFQGAEPRLLKEFSEGWRGHVPDLYRISRNHRSLPSIIRLSNKINAAMTEVIPLRMMPFRGLGPDGGEAESGLTRIIRSSMPSDIAAVIAKEIQHDSQLKKAPLEYRDNAILVRSAIQVRDVEGALVRLRIPYIVRGGRGLLQTEEVKDILSYFRLAVNHKDFPAFVRAVGVPKRGIGDVAIERLRSQASEEHGGDLVEACTSMDKLDVFYSNMSQVTAMLDDPAAAMEALVRLFGYKDYISGKYRREESKARAKHENIDRFLSLVRSLADEGRTSEDLVFHLAMDRPSDDGEEEDKGAVTVSTIHSAKGLEWRRVYITNVTEGSLPHRFSMGSPSEVEEERRLFYVACTRAKDSLAICVHSLEPRGPNTLSVAPSRFLGEVGIRT